MSNEKEAAAVIKETNVKGGRQKNTKTLHKVNCTQKPTTMNRITKNIKNINHMKNWQNNSEASNNKLRVQQDTSENNETINETESYDKSSVRKDIINLKNDIEKIKTLKSLLTKQ